MLGEGRAGLCAFSAFVCFARVGLWLVSILLGIKDWLRLVIAQHLDVSFLPL